MNSFMSFLFTRPELKCFLIVKNQRYVISKQIEFTKQLEILKWNCHRNVHDFLTLLLLLLSLLFLHVIYLFISAPSTDTCVAWCRVLSHLVAAYRNAERQEAFDNWIKAQFARADINANGVLNFAECLELLKQMNKAAPKKLVKKLFDVREYIHLFVPKRSLLKPEWSICPTFIHTRHMVAYTINLIRWPLTALEVWVHWSTLGLFYRHELSSEITQLAQPVLIIYRKHRLEYFV